MHTIRATLRPAPIVSDVVYEHERRDLGEQARGVEIRLVHGLSTSKPSADFDTQGRLLPVGSVAGSSLAAQGRESSLPV